MNWTEFQDYIKDKSFIELQSMRGEINKEWDKLEEEFCAKLNTGDIYEFRKDNKNHIGVVTEVRNKTIILRDMEQNIWAIECSEILQKIQ